MISDQPLKLANNIDHHRPSSLTQRVLAAGLTLSQRIRWTLIQLRSLKLSSSAFIRFISLDKKSLDFLVRAFPHQHAAAVWCVAADDERNPCGLTFGTKWFGAKVWIDSGRTNHRGLGVLWSDMGIDFAASCFVVFLVSVFRTIIRHIYGTLTKRWISGMDRKEWHSWILPEFYEGMPPSECQHFERRQGPIWGEWNVSLLNMLTMLPTLQNTLRKLRS